MILPNLLVIGAMKSGTTSFHDMLNQHPEVFMSPVKEINFFSHDDLWNNGVKWYTQHFREGAHSKIIGESSVNYSKRQAFKYVPERIAQILGSNIKFIYLLRDPIDRFRSNFTDGKTFGDIPPEMSIDDFVNHWPINENPYIKTGLYFYQLSNYQKFFSKDQFLLLEFERLVHDTQKLMKEVCSFLDISDIHFRPVEANRSSVKKYQSKLARRLTGIKAVVPKSIKTKMRNSGFVQSMLSRKPNDSINALNENSIRLLSQFYRTDIEALFKHFGFSPKYWNSYT